MIAVDPASAPARRALCSYWEDIVSRYWNRAATAAEVAQVLEEEPSDDLILPRGQFVVAVAGCQVLGCRGVRLGPDNIAELTRIHVATAFRRRGLGTHIITYLERQATAQGKTRMRLDIRSDLVEARAVYAQLGYREVPRFNDHRYVAHWLEKRLCPPSV